MQKIFFILFIDANILAFELNFIKPYNKLKRVKYQCKYFLKTLENWFTKSYNKCSLFYGTVAMIVQLHISFVIIFLL